MKAIGGGSIWERLPTPGFLLAEPKCGLGSVGHPCGGVLPEAMTHPVQLYCWHFMAYPHLPADFDKRYETGWVTCPTRSSRGRLLICWSHSCGLAACHNRRIG